MSTTTEKKETAMPTAQKKETAMPTAIDRDRLNPRHRLDLDAAAAAGDTAALAQHEAAAREQAADSARFALVQQHADRIGQLRRHLADESARIAATDQPGDVDPLAAIAAELAAAIAAHAVLTGPHYGVATELRIGDQARKALAAGVRARRDTACGWGREHLIQATAKRALGESHDLPEGWTEEQLGAALAGWTTPGQRAADEQRLIKDGWLGIVGDGDGTRVVPARTYEITESA